MTNKNSRGRVGITLACIVAIIIVCSMYIIPAVMYPLKYKEYVEKYSREYDLEKELVYAVIKTESSFRSGAVSDKGAIGLMQIMEPTADWIVEHSHIEAEKYEYSDPDINIHMGCWYLNYLMDYFDDEDLALAAYNAGMGNVSNWLKDKNYSADGFKLSQIPFKETREYVKKVGSAKIVYELLYFQ